MTEQKFKVLAKEGAARVGLYQTEHGVFDTPAFMPVGTQGTVKGVTPAELTKLGAQIVLTNTYHLELRPGSELIRDLGGIHRFMAWPGPILSDSGGYQVFSLAKLRKIDPLGVTFQSHLDGAAVRFTPERVIQIQENLGVDIMMVLDECLPPDASHEQAKRSWQLTLDWAKRSLQAKSRSDNSVFGIVQGGMFEDLRIQSAADLSKLPFDGYAIGGLSVGESIEQMRKLTTVSASALPEDKIRYLMGVGTPWDIVESVRRGVDLFDCVIPTRSARFGRLFVGRSWINIKNQQFRADPGALDPECDCYCCQNFSRSYLSHLTHAREILAVQLASLHNLRFYQRLMSDIRQHIGAGSFSEFADSFSADWVANLPVASAQD